MAEAQGFDVGADKEFPNRTEEMDGVDLEPVVVGPPSYGSPEGEGVGNSLVPAADNPNVLGAEGKEVIAGLDSEELAEAGRKGQVGSTDAADRKAADWKKMVDNAENEEQLAAVEAEYKESKADYKTVKDALKSRRDELKAEAKANEQQAREAEEAAAANAESQ